jgi:hypothetical protein
MDRQQTSMQTAINRAIARAHRAEEQLTQERANSTAMLDTLKGIKENTSPKRAPSLNSLSQDEQQQILRNAFTTPTNEQEAERQRAALGVLPDVLSQMARGAASSETDAKLAAERQQRAHQTAKQEVYSQIAAEFGEEASSPTSPLRRAANQVLGHFKAQRPDIQEVFPAVDLLSFLLAERALLLKGKPLRSYLNESGQQAPGMPLDGGTAGRSGRAPDEVGAAIFKGDLDGALEATARRMYRTSRGQ